MNAEFETSYTPMLPVLMETLMSAYRELRGERGDLPETPRLALVDVEGSPSVPEFRIICAAAKEAGSRRSTRRSTRSSTTAPLLRVQGEPVHLVYRRRCSRTCPRRPDRRARDRRAAVVNPFRARVANNKKLFALLADPRFAHLVEDAERQVIAETIPWTRVLREARRARRLGRGPARVRLGQPRAARAEAGVGLRRPRRLARHGDLAGRLGSADRGAPRPGDYVVQEYVPVPEEMFPRSRTGHVHMRLKRFNINPFGIGGRYAGMITRISDQAVINVSAGGGLLPSVVGRHRRDFSQRRARTMRPLGYDVDDNASRFSNYFHVLRELVHFTNGWMPLEPSWERKYALGDHVHDDARALTKIKRRLYELRHPSEYPGSPSPELASCSTGWRPRQRRST